MNIELLGRQAIDRIKSEWGLPLRGFVAGGSIANIVWELVSGNKAVINDIDVFIFDGIEENLDTKKDTLFNYQEKETKYYEDYTGMCFNTYTKDFYSIVEAERDGIFNTIKYRSNTNDPALIINSFDINATRIGYNIEKDELYWTKEFEEFINTGNLKVTNLMTPSHTAVRIAKKSIDLNVGLSEFEFQLLQHSLIYNFADRIKYRFRERYFEMYNQHSHLLKDFFTIERDYEAEDYVMIQYQKDVTLFYLKPIEEKKETKDEFDMVKYHSRMDIFKDDNISRIFKSTDFLFYMRNIYNKPELKELWYKLYYFFNDVDYIDKEVSAEDIDLLMRFSTNAPNSISNLKGMKISEQIELIKKFLENYKDDPIVAISILESVKVDKDIELDEQTSLILELSVRRQIVNDTRGKVNKILKKEQDNISDEVDTDFDF